MQEPLIILSPPRSFSSIVSTMIGEHPQLYGFPELHLFSADTLEEVIYKEQKAGYPAPPGLIRTLAQEHDGVQTTKTVLKAIAWVQEHKHWSTKKLLDYLLDLIAPKIGVEKSPITARKFKNLERAYAMFPNAYYLHLTRHPLSARRSIQEFYNRKKRLKNHNPQALKYLVDSLVIWYLMHRNIINFTNALPVGQTMKIKGEDLLSNPDTYLPQIAEWMGLRTDAEAIEAMKKPEKSPYAYVGPAPVRGGNDPKFMRNPKLRSVKIQEPSLQDFFINQHWQLIDDDIKEVFAENNLKLTPERELVVHITELANAIGYQ